VYPESRQDRIGGIDQALAADIERARATVDVAVFDLRLPSIVDALVRAAQRGVRVRLVVDYEENESAAEFTDAISRLEQAGVEVSRDHRSALMHHKFVIVDGRVLWTGSMNLTANDVYRNNNNMLRLDLPELAANYAVRFEWQLQRRADASPVGAAPSLHRVPSDGTRIETYFSPNGGAQRAILNRIEGAKKSIRITAFTFTDTEMGELLMEKHSAGVQVQGVFESRNNNVLGAEYSILAKAGLDVLEDGNCYNLHSKTIVIDDTTLITGSYNFTDSANRSNDENLLIIDDPALARAYSEEFDRIYAQAKSPTRCGS
jgi:phosphatidylserine/phosphatidylglycerophosphate/cardiolipin synthase-like enzyme